MAMSLKEIALEIPNMAFGWRNEQPEELWYGKDSVSGNTGIGIKSFTDWDGKLYNPQDVNAYFLNPMQQLRRIRKSPAKLLDFYKSCEIVYACIEALARSAVDPELIVEEKKTEIIKIHPDAKDLDRRFKSVKRSYWARNDEHPMISMLMRPNPEMSLHDFLKCWIVSKHVFGVFYAEKVMGTDGKTPVELWPIDPRKICNNKTRGNRVLSYKFQTTDIYGKNYETVIPAENMFVDRGLDIGDIYYGKLSPLEAAVGSVDADILQTNYIRSYFTNAGVPSGILTVANKTLNNRKADKMKKRWMDHFSSYSGGQHSVVVLDQNATYQPIGAKLKDLEAESVQGRVEAKICTVFGVPPGLIFSYTGLRNMSYTNQQQALSDFWSVKLYPMFKEMLGVLTWKLLNHFVDEEDIRARRVRVNWDMRGVKALQEDQKSLAERIVVLSDGGLIDKNEAREAVGASPDPYGAGLFRSNVKFTSMYGDIVAMDGDTFGSIPALQSISVGKDGEEPANPADSQQPKTDDSGDSSKKQLEMDPEPEPVNA